ncbi:MAG: hypothetical protein KC462_04000, partial [Cyanobacteria bacterium HKST-UBA05]|nr:hypothetical protein [Cyanobacteria bacterium HKST-UBA05]
KRESILLGVLSTFLRLGVSSPPQFGRLLLYRRADDVAQQRDPFSAIPISNELSRPADAVTMHRPISRDAYYSQAIAPEFVPGNCPALEWVASQPAAAIDIVITSGDVYQTTVRPNQVKLEAYLGVFMPSRHPEVPDRWHENLHVAESQRINRPGPWIEWGSWRLGQDWLPMTRWQTRVWQQAEQFTRAALRQTPQLEQGYKRDHPEEHRQPVRSAAGDFPATSNTEPIREDIDP